MRFTIVFQCKISRLRWCCPSVLPINLPCHEGFINKASQLLSFKSLCMHACMHAKHSLLKCIWVLLVPHGNVDVGYLLVLLESASMAEPKAKCPVCSHAAEHRKYCSWSISTSNSVQHACTCTLATTDKNTNFWGVCVAKGQAALIQYDIVVCWLQQPDALATGDTPFKSAVCDML